MLNKGVYFISGIDTNIGKSIATGWLARELMAQGVSVMTQKMVQTGNEAISEDIELHRKIMGLPLSDDDRSGVTCPIVFTYPASPHLAAKIDRRTLDTALICEATEKLAKRYDVVLLEGAGGLMVPLSGDMLTIDYVESKRYPTILVSSGRLGSINHTILSIEALLSRKIPLAAIVYNRYPACDELIESDTKEYLKRYLEHHSPETMFWEIDKIKI
ncbi:MAG: dethiobiotin synthase [Rikenellaceae bacterium]